MTGDASELVGRRFRGTLRFGEFEMTVPNGTLRGRGGREIDIERLPREALEFLALRSQTLVSHVEMRQLLWPEYSQDVSVENLIHSVISKVRQALGDRAERPKFVATVSRQGYRFVAEVTRVEAQAPSLRTIIPLPATPVAPPVASVDEHLRAYVPRTETLRRNLLLQLVLASAGLAVMRQAPTALIRVLSFAIPAALIYCWFEFGFVLDDLIKWRSAAWKRLRDVGSMESANLFNDGGFVDGWFMLFRPAEHSIDTRLAAGSKAAFMMVYCPLIAVGHATVAALLLAGAENELRAKPMPPAEAFLLSTLPWLATALILGSHLQFRRGGPHPNWAQWLVITLFAVITFALIFGH